MADFTPSNAPLPSPASGSFAQRPLAVPAGRGMTWWSEGWRLFAAAPMIWIAITVILFVVMLLVGFIPILGTVATTLLGPVFAGGVMIGCRSLDHGGELKIEHLFAGFSDRLAPLMIVGAIYLVGSFLIVMIVLAGMAAAIGFGGISALLSGDPSHAALAILTGFGFGALLALLVGFLLGIPLMMAFWFAPALVVFRNEEPWSAMKSSFSASLVDWLPMFVYGLVGIALAIVASIPLMLGWLVLAPVFAASVYASYKDIFGDPG